MCFILGLDPNIYLFKDEDFSTPKLDIAIADIEEKFELAKKYELRYLYNSYFDMPQILGATKNIFCELSNDPAFVTLNNLGNDNMKYFEKKYSSCNIAHDTLIYNFNNLLDQYISGFFQYLYENYFHTLIVSNNESIVQMHNQSFYLKKDYLSIIKSKGIPFLLKPNTYDTFLQYFSTYHAFFGREKYNIILSDCFLGKVKKLSTDEFYDTLTSLFRGIYFPDFMLRHGDESICFTITTHSDKDTKTMKVDDNNTTLYRIHCVGINQAHGGEKRICYTKNQDYYFVFYYHTKHCDTLDHAENIKNPFIYKNLKKIQIKKNFTLKIRK